MDELLDSLYSNFALAELDPSGDSRPAGNLGAGFIRLSVTHNSRLDSSQGWVAKELTLPQFECLFLEHGEFERKEDSPGYVPGVMQGERRLKQAISQLDWLIIDLDKGEDINAVIAAAKAKELCAFIHSTYSHLSQETEISLDDYRKFMGSNAVTDAGLRSYLLEVRNYRPWVVENVEVAETYKDAPSGAVCVAHHAPLPKYRMVFPLAKPFSRQNHFNDGGTQKSFEALWKAKYGTFANSLGLKWDRSCTDINRAFYWPSCKPGAERMATKIEGQFLDLDAFEVQLEQSDGGKSAASKLEHTSLTFQGFDLKAWAAQYGATFQIEDALRSSSNLSSDFFRTERDEGGVHIECPFENEHTEPGGTGTFVVNASENADHGFSIFCSHSSCKTRRGRGASVDRLLFLREDAGGWLAEAR